MSDTTTSPRPLTITIFGSTGGTGLALLLACLRTSSTTAIQIRVLVRNPSKLLSLLHLTAAPPNLKIITGSITDPAAVTSSLTGGDPNGSLPDVVVSAVGIVGNFSSLHPWKGLDLHLCENATRLITDSIASLHRDAVNASSTGAAAARSIAKPLFIVLSTTGISAAGRDIPMSMVPFYHYALSTPHVDKAAAEKHLQSLPACTASSYYGYPNSDAVTQGLQPWIAIRPSFLQGTGQEGPSGKKIRVGIERNGKIEKKEVGHFISREDVGEWVFGELACKWVGEGTGRRAVEGFLGSAVSLTW